MKISLSRAKDYKKYGLFGVVILILVLMIFSVVTDYFSSPSQGVISQSAQEKSTKVNLLGFVGKKFSFSYPNYFQPLQTSAVDGSDIEKYAFAATQTTTWNINVRVSTLSQPTLANDPSYNLRKTNPQTYSNEVVILGNNKAHIMTYTGGGYSKVVFLINDSIDASIVLSSSSSLDSAKMDIVLNQIIASWKWL